jgi:hypothetical protein
MSFTLSARSLGFVSHVDPRLIAVAQHAIGITEQDFGFTAEQSRTLAEEEVLLREGHSHTLHSHHIVDCIAPGHWAAAGHSGAVDAVAWDGAKFVWEMPRQAVIASAFLAAFKTLGIEGTWGCAWGLLMSEIPGDGSPAAMLAAQQKYGGWDGPHFELGRNT